MGLFDFLKKKKTNVSNAQASLEEKTDNSGKTRISLLPSKNLVDELAHFHTMTLDESEAIAMENELLKRGSEILPILVDYLLFCSTGRQSEGWWYNAKRLVKLIHRFPNVNHKMQLSRLINQQSNIWEYQTEVKDIAETELKLIEKPELADKTPNIICAKDARFVLKQTENFGMPLQRLEALFKLRDSSHNWSDEDKAYYYFIHAGAARVLYPNNNAHLAFYAAQIFYNPDNTCFGWTFFQVPPSPESAKKLHEQYPLPANMDEVKNYSH